MSDTMNGEAINFADFAGDDDGPALAPTAVVEPKEVRPAKNVPVIPSEDDGLSFDLPAEGEDGEPVEQKEATDELDDDMIDELDVEGEQSTADDIVEIDENTKLTKQEIKELHEKKQEYSRYSDELAMVEVEKTTLQKMNTVFHESANYVKAQYDAALSLVQAIIPVEPSMELMRSNPDAYQAQKTYRENLIAYYNDAKLKAENYSTEINKRSTADVETQSKQRVEAEVQKLLRAVPQLKSDKKVEGYLRSLDEVGKKYGYTSKEIRSAVGQDHRIALIMRKAALYDAKVAARPNPVMQKSFTIPAATKPAQVSQKTADKKSLQTALKKAETPNSNRPQSLRELGRFFNAD
jgi:hypothetical protein